LPTAILGRADVVGLKVDRHGGGIIRHDTERRVSTGAVGRGGDDPCMHEAMLLRRGDDTQHGEVRYKGKQRPVFRGDYDAICNRR